MNLEIIQNKKTWQNFIKKNKANLLESWQWKEFKESLGLKVTPVALKKDNNILLTALIVKKDLILNQNYLYTPKGPVFKKNLGKKEKNDLFFEFISKIKEKFQVNNPIFFKVEPEDFKPDSNEYKIFKTSCIQPEKTAILDIRPDIDKILSNMHSKTRYNIRLAKRKGVKTKKSDNFKDIKIFLKLLHITTKREGFQPHLDKYYKKLLKLENINLYLAFFKKTPIAAHIVGTFGDFGYYLHGASSREHSKVMAPHRLHFKAIQDLKEKEIKYYDFWGIDKDKWPGLTRFKMGFGSKRVVYPGTFDICFNKFWYFLYKFAKKIKALIS